MVDQNENKPKEIYLHAIHLYKWFKMDMVFMLGMPTQIVTIQGQWCHFTTYQQAVIPNKYTTMNEVRSQLISVILKFKPEEENKIVIRITH